MVKRKETMVEQIFGYYADETGIYEVTYSYLTENLIHFQIVTVLVETPDMEKRKSGFVGFIDNVTQDKQSAIRLYKVCLNSFYNALFKISSSYKEAIINVININRDEIVNSLRFFNINEATKNL